MQACFSIAYLPPVHWLRAALKQDQILIEACESWQKQSYRNRTYIAGPQGKLMLNIPVDHSTTGGRIDEVSISYSENWQHRHWQAILSAYGTAPFFESLAVELESFYSRKAENLFDYNLQLLELIFNWLQVDPDFALTTDFRQEYPQDFRHSIHPKQSLPTYHPYPQVFDDKLGFIPGLSVLDLIFNEGPAAYDHLVG